MEMAEPSGYPGEGTALFGARYALQGLLGRGGMGSVYRALDTVRGRAVALKCLELGPPPEPTTHASRSLDTAFARTTSRKETQKRGQMIALFRREYFTLSQLAHPRIIEVFDYGLTERGPYYTMELLEGSDLSQVSRLPWQRSCEVLRDIAAALTLLHSRRLLHRDISPRNVHYAADGCAKLIDFGAMSAMGVPKLLVGTPPFIPPEALQQQSLDARSDLYSLGALGYYMLTGRLAYPAQSLAELRDLFRTRPAPPSTYASDVPKQLDSLIMQLLSMDRAARPTTAIEVMERLTALAGLGDNSGLAVPHAYLTTPALVGRDTELLRVRRRTMRALRGRGACLLVTGAAGSGRSRFLDACALEAKLTGSLLLRADAADASSGAYGVLRSLLRQLHQTLTAAERGAVPLPKPARALLPDINWDTLPPPRMSRPPSIRPVPRVASREELCTELAVYFPALATQRSMMIAIDDFDAIDEPSAAFIATLSRSTRTCRLVLVASQEAGDTPTPVRHALDMLSQAARLIPLAPLSEVDGESLLRSVFGDVPNLAVVASRIHALATGNPRLIIELAQHLVDRGVVRYENGGFVLPDALESGDLPETLAGALRARVARLSPEAFALAAFVALCASAPLGIDEAFALAGLTEASRAEAALAEVVRAQIVAVHDEERLVLRQAAFVQALVAGLTPPRKAELHAQIAQLFARDSRRLRASEHFFRAGLTAEAIDTLVQCAVGERHNQDWFPGYRALFEEGLQACVRLQRPGREAFFLRRALTHHILHYLESCDREMLLDMAHELYALSGLADWDALGDEADPNERLTRAFAAATDRYEAAPPSERKLPPVDAIRELALYLRASAGYGASAFDFDLLERLPSMAAFAVLSPSITLVETLVAALQDLRAGRNEGYRRGFDALLARLEQPDRAGLSEREYPATRMGVLYGIALTEAACGMPEAFTYADELEALPSQRGNAWRVRQLAHLYLSNTREAEECRRKVEVLQIQSGPRQFMQGGTLEVEFMYYLRADDLVGLRHCLPDLEKMAALHPGWQVQLVLTRAELERIRGRPEQALPLYEEAMRLGPSGRHTMWPYAAAFQVEALIELGRVDEARRIGLAYLETCARERFGALSDFLNVQVALADARLGNHEAAVARAEPVLAATRQGKMRGLFAGIQYEARARVALLGGDVVTFSHCLDQCRLHYRYGQHPALTARVDRLVEEARRSNLIGLAALPDEHGRVSPDRVRRELASCPDAAERATRALALLIEASGADEGYLYGVQESVLHLIASDAAEPPPPAMQKYLEQFVAVQGRIDDRTIAMDGDSIAEERGDIVPLTLGSQSYEPFALAVERGTDFIITAAAALSFPRAMRRYPARDMLQAIGDELLSRGDVSGVTLTR